MYLVFSQLVATVVFLTVLDLYEDEARRDSSTTLQEARSSLSCGSESVKKVSIALDIECPAALLMDLDGKVAKGGASLAELAETLSGLGVSTSAALVRSSARLPNNSLAIACLTPDASTDTPHFVVYWTNENGTTLRLLDKGATTQLLPLGYKERETAVLFAAMPGQSNGFSTGLVISVALVLGTVFAYFYGRSPTLYRLQLVNERAFRPVFSMLIKSHILILLAFVGCNRRASDELKDFLPLQSRLMVERLEPKAELNNVVTTTANSQVSFTYRITNNSKQSYTDIRLLADCQCQLEPVPEALSPGQSDLISFWVPSPTYGRKDLRIPLVADSMAMPLAIFDF